MSELLHYFEDVTSEAMDPVLQELEAEVVSDAEELARESAAATDVSIEAGKFLVEHSLPDELLRAVEDPTAGAVKAAEDILQESEATGFSDSLRKQVVSARNLRHIREQLRRLNETENQ